MIKSIYAVGKCIQMTMIIDSDPYPRFVYKPEITLMEIQNSLNDLTFFEIEEDAKEYAKKNMSISLMKYGDNELGETNYSPLIFKIKLIPDNILLVGKIEEIIKHPTFNCVNIPADLSSLKIVRKTRSYLGYILPCFFSTKPANEPLSCNSKNFIGDFDKFKEKMYRAERVAVFTLGNRNKLLPSLIPKDIELEISEYVAGFHKPKLKTM